MNCILDSFSGLVENAARALTVSTLLVFVVSAKADDTKKFDFSIEIAQIESSLRTGKHDEAKVHAIQTASRHPNFTQGAAYVHMILGEPTTALKLLDNAHQKECASLSKQHTKVWQADDYAYTHCFIHWLIKSKAYFALRDWSKAIEAIETLGLVSRPNSIDSELIFYAIASKVSSLKNAGLDESLNTLLSMHPNQFDAKLVNAIVNGAEKEQFNFSNRYESTLLLVATALSARLIHQRSNFFPQILSSLEKTVPYELSGENLNIGILRHIQKTAN